MVTSLGVYPDSLFGFIGGLPVTHHVHTIGF